MLSNDSTQKPLPKGAKLLRQTLPVSVVVITLNEADNIDRCLRSVLWADEIIVLDSGSTDGTIDLAQNLGAKVSQQAWMGFGLQKQAAVKLAKHDWIFSIDADEEISEALCLEIQQKFAGLNPQVGYKIPRLSFYLGRWIRRGGWHPDYQLRLFHRQYSKWTSAEIHERVESPLYETLTNNLNHYVFRSIEQHIATNNRYSSLQADQLIKKGEKVHLLKVLTKPISKFIETYLFKLGFLDGFVGFFISIGAAYSVFLKWSKVWESQNGYFKSKNSRPK